MRTFVRGLEDVDRTQIAEVGGKGANLGELLRLGVSVPSGFCVTTAAWAEVTSGLAAQIARLDGPDAGPAEAAAVRDALLDLPWPETLTAAVVERVAPGPYAVRSSATAEDLPTASFAGQHDSFLHVVGAEAVLAHVRRCWASLFTDRAVAYRRHHGVPHRAVSMAVVVQRLLDPQAAGVLFTADPVTGNLHVSVVDAVPGLAEDLVAGRVAPETSRIRDGQVLAPSTLLSDVQLTALEALGRRLEAHFGAPQDIEWCLVDGAFHVVQSRPITTLFPLPALPDTTPRVLLSVGHQQMMTDAMKPLGWSLFQATSAGRMGMLEAGGRLFVDATAQLVAPASRGGLLGMLGRADPLTHDALITLLGRGFLAVTPADPNAPVVPWGPPAADPDPAMVPRLIARWDAALELARETLRDLTGDALFDALDADIAALKQSIGEPGNMVAILAGMNATNWLHDRMAAWLGESNAADVFARSAPDNVTSAMGLALLDVADAVRPHPAVLEVLGEATDADLLERLDAVAGGPEARAALEGFLDRYGARCVGEIDVTRPRWVERPTALVPLILGNVAQFAPGEAARRFAAGSEAAAAHEMRLLERLAALPDGETKVVETAARIRQLRAFVGYREYPKYAIVQRYLVFKRALGAEAARLVAAGVLAEADDLQFLTLAEIREVARTGAVAPGLLAQRALDHARNQRLAPPRVMTSEGEGLSGSFRRVGVPAGVLVGLGVSSGVVEGRARVVFDLADATLEAGDILVTRFTDPSWTPAFVAVRGLVTEVGGLMTHGAVIAREYGLPAVVGVDGATARIADGQWIRVDGAAGTVELLEGRPAGSVG